MVRIERQLLHRAFDTLGSVLRDRGARFEVVVVGGAAMLLHADVRPTQDVDAIAVGDGVSAPRPVHELPPELVGAAVDVAVVLGLDDDWLNTGVVAVTSHVEPADYLTNASSTVYGDGALRVTTVGRQGLLRLKFIAAVDEGAGSVHEADLRALRPTPSELEDLASWYLQRYGDRADPGWGGTVARIRSEPAT